MPELQVGVVGGTGIAGREVLRLLVERGFPCERPRLFGTERTAGAVLDDDDVRGAVELLEPGVFQGLDVLFLAGGPALSERCAGEAVGAGALVVDLSSRFRLHPDVPVVVPEVNAGALAAIGTAGLVAMPSPTGIALAVVLAPLAAEWPIRRVTVATYQGAAGAGTRAVRRLLRDSIQLLSGRGGGRSAAFDCVPQVGAFEPSGATAHEAQVVAELGKVLGAAAPPLAVCAVRVPVMAGVGLAVSIESDTPMPVADVATVLRPAPGVLLHAGEERALATLREVVGSEATHVSRLRVDASVPHGVACWVAIDSVVKGRALNAVQVAELLVRDRR